MKKIFTYFSRGEMALWCASVALILISFCVFDRGNIQTPLASLVGVTAMDPVYGGTGSGAVDADGAPNYLDVLTGAGFDVVVMRSTYSTGPSPS